ncbi:MAG: hypothetical protein OEW32_05730 [Nitrospira sp.]|nr:hypothetical protein [Nitrospira sp.]
MKSLQRAIQRHPELPTAYTSIKDLLRHFGAVPPNSLRALLIRTGPFDAFTDAFRFKNSFPITEDNGQQIRRRFQNALNTVMGITESRFKTPLDDIDLNVSGIGPKISIPDVIKGQVLQRVAAELIGDLEQRLPMLYQAHSAAAGGWHSPDTISSFMGTLLTNASAPPRR